MLDVKNITCSRGHRQLFNDLSFSVGIGQVFVIEGKNGSGKSTLLKIIAGLRQPDIGEVVWNQQSTGSIATEYSQQISWLSHRNGINDSLTAKENIQLSHGLTKSNNAGINYLLDKVGLKGFANIPVRQFSAGMKRRLALSRLLANKAKLWLLDEPQGALDKEGITLLNEIIEDHVSNDGMVVMSSHHDVSFNNVPVNYIYL